MAKKSYVSVPKLYQNPKKYHQIHYTRVKPYGQVGYTVSRGDLVFYYQPGTRTIWHVAIYLGNNMVIESWPPRIMVQPISNSQRNVIAGIKRPFL